MDQNATPFFSNPNQKSKEKSILLFLLIFGIVGLIYLQYATTNRKDAQSSGGSRNIYQEQSNVQKLSEVQAAASSLPKIKGDLITKSHEIEPLKPFQFRLTNANQDVTYVIDLGDGNKKTFGEDGRISHIYKKEGDLKVVVYGTYEGNTQVIKEQKFTVNNPVEVDPAASGVDR